MDLQTNLEIGDKPLFNLSLVVCVNLLFSLLCADTPPSAFLFRDPHFDDQQARLHDTEAGNAKGDDKRETAAKREANKFKIESELCGEALRRLRDDLERRSECEPLFEFFGEDVYQTPKDGARLMYLFSKHVLEAMLPDEPPNAAERESSMHYGFSIARSRIYVGGEGYVDRILQYAENADSTPALLVIRCSGGFTFLLPTLDLFLFSSFFSHLIRIVAICCMTRGQSGGGKSSLVSLASRKSADRGMRVFAHFIGCTSQSTLCRNLLDRLSWFLAEKVFVEFVMIDRCSQH